MFNLMGLAIKELKSFIQQALGFRCLAATHEFRNPLVQTLLHAALAGSASVHRLAVLRPGFARAFVEVWSTGTGVASRP